MFGISAPHFMMSSFGTLLATALLTLVSFTAAREAAPSAPIRLSDAGGNIQEPLKDHGQKATALIFLSSDCPLGNSYAPEIARIVGEFKARGIAFFAVYAGETKDAVSRHLSEFKLPLTGLSDPGQLLATATQATVTPEVAIVSPDGSLLYRGRIDDRAVKLGKVRVEPTKRDFRLALEAIVAGRTVPEKFTKAIGCYLPPVATASK